MAAPKLHRWLDLIAYLAGRRRPVPVEDLMEGVPSYGERWRDADAKGRATVRRMFERDKEELRALGIPIETVPGPVPGDPEGSGYRLARRDFYLPYLRLLDDAAPGGAAPTEPGGAASAPGASGGDTSGGDASAGGGRKAAASGGDASAGGGRKAAASGARASGAGASRAAGAGGASASSGTFDIGGDEAGAAVEGLLHLSDLPDFPLVREARAAYRKLTFDLDPSRFHASPVMVLPPAGARVGEVADILTDALLRRKRVTFDYHGLRRDEVTRREVAPYGLLFERGQWYLVGHAALRDEVRVFRLSRMHDVRTRELRAGEVRSGGGEFEVPADFDLGQWAGREAWELEWEEERAPTAVRARFNAPRSLWADRNRFGEAVERDADGATLREFRVHDPEPFVRWILSMDGEAEIADPASMREEARRKAERVRRLHVSETADG